ncbi:hypothetical protein V6N11_056138 [Hibiscus sabdariffa]|uniref:Uncharacterized protein n=1 Tax=Hibiscus sabdariffa TaxID=183260 RepID=A0ABR2T3T5_9ROSI
MMISERRKAHRSSDSGDSHPRRLLGCFCGHWGCFRESERRNRENLIFTTTDVVRRNGRRSKRRPQNRGLGFMAENEF